jgi:hypothetical protein
LFGSANLRIVFSLTGVDFARLSSPIMALQHGRFARNLGAKVIPGREEKFYEHAGTIEKTVAEQPDCLAVLKLHYLRWLLFPIKGETYFMYQGIFDTDFDKYTEDAVALFSATGISTVFENLEGFPADWKTNPPAFVKFVRSTSVRASSNMASTRT